MRRLAGLALVVVALAGCGAAEEHKESVAESTHEAAVEQKQQAAEEHCKDKGEIIAQGNDETTECVSMEEKQHEIERDTESGSHYEAEQQANENEAEKRKDEEAEKIEQERSGG
jgi:nitrous oxide reductase accessory protein NosL